MEYFIKDTIKEVEKQKKRTLIVYFAVLLAVIGGSLGFMFWYWGMPYKDANILTCKICAYSLVILFVIFSFIYLGIKYKRVRKFYKFCVVLDTGLKETSNGVFLGYDEDEEVKEGVDCKSLIFSEWNKYKGEFFERKVLVFSERPFPEIEVNDKVEFVTQGNFLISYQIVNEDSANPETEITEENKTVNK